MMISLQIGLIHQKKVLNSMANKRTFKGCNKQQHKTKAHKKATNKIINKTYAEYKQRELN